ncbi:MAG: 2-oxo acid dehydrogenase subunit E2 [Myxococcota bacterium]
MSSPTHPMSPFSPMKEVSTFRRMAATMWKAPSDPTIYGSMDVDVTETLAELQRYRERTGVRLTMTHIVTRAAALAFARYPHLNAKVRWGGRLEQRSSVDLFVSVATDSGKDLSGARIDAVDRLSLAELVAAVEGKAKGIRTGKDESFEKSRGLFQKTPFWILRPLLKLIDFLSNELHLHLPKQGMPRDPFGAAVITNVGMFGIDTAFAPFVPLGRCPMLLLVTEVKPRPWVVGNKLEVRQVLRLCGTFDHRIIDGFAAGLLAKEIRHHVEHPELDSAPAVAQVA